MWNSGETIYNSFQGEQLSKANGKKKKGKEKRLVKHTTKLAETLLVPNLKRRLAKQASSIDQLTKSLKPLEKYTTITERQFKTIKQMEVQIKQLQKQTFDILKAVRKSNNRITNRQRKDLVMR